MKARVVLLGVSMLLGVACSREAAPVPATSAATEAVAQAESAATPSLPAAPAETVIAKLYAEHRQDRSPFFQDSNRGLVDSYFEKTLADLIWNDVVASKGEVGAIGSDPLYDAQDTEIRNFVVGPAVITDGRARVAAAFENFGKKQEVVYTLVQEGGAWKITDMSYADGSTLRTLLSAAATGS